MGSSLLYIDWHFFGYSCCSGGIEFHPETVECCKSVMDVLAWRLNLAWFQTFGCVLCLLDSVPVAMQDTLAILLTVCCGLSHMHLCNFDLAIVFSSLGSLQHAAFSIWLCYSVV